MFKATAIVIDDNVHNVSVLRMLLQIEDVDCVPITKVTNLAAQLAEVDSTNVIFLDLELPKTDGYEVLQWLKAQPKFKGIPVIAYTIHISEMRHAFDMGFDGFLGKPVDAEAFPEQLASILRGEKVWYAP